MELSSYALSPLREGQFTLYRGHGDGLAPILLVAPAGEYPSSFALQRLEHEYALRTELDAEWAAQPVELIRREGRLMLVLADPGGEPLERLVGQPMAVAEFLHIAVPLAAAVGQLHARGVIHKDLKPANILVGTANGDVWLTGFGIASRQRREHQAPAPPEIIAGTLAYMAPEQTGRMNRSVDSRSDLYALGITFYEMLTGALPFTAADPMEWVHCHIARQPVPPDARVVGIPGALSEIVVKLLAKTADDRYQTAAGVEADLQHCLAEWDATGSIAPFPLGRHDGSDRLLIPEKLYGRERETEALLAAFDGVVAQGTPELVLVSGYSGIGKSSVVNELHKALVPPRGLFAAGKFDQYKRDIPYATLAQAFQSLVRPLLGQSEAELGRWRDALSEALGPNGQLIVNLVPELELVIGKQPPVQDRPPKDAQNRFQMVFRRFLGVFAQAEHPLTLFLDDLQWLDMATLDLLEHLATHSEVRHLLLVGAYRDNEVGPAHPLLRTLEAIRGAGARVQEIVLAPLGHGDVGRLVADALHCALARAQPLAQLVHEKTGGNPFFAIQFFTELADEGQLALDPVTRTWQWDMNRIRAKSYTDNVVDLMAGKLKRLPAATRDALKQLACLGNAAETATLTLVYGQTEVAMDASLREAVHAGLVFRDDSSYRFLHDRIQQAAYTLIPETQRAEVHLRIGRVLLASMTADQLAEHLFDVANQSNRGAKLLVDQDEKAQVATVNLRAGRKAKASAAYASARAYFATGMALLDETDWDRRYELTFSLWLGCAECSFLTGDDKAAQLIGELLQRGASKIDLAAVYHLKIQFHVMKSENPQAVGSALTCLRLFGIDIPAHPTSEQVQAEYETVWQTLNGRPTESLIEMPLMTDPKLQAAMRVLSILAIPAYLTDFHLFCWLACRMVKVAMKHGISGASTHGYAQFGGFILGPVFHRYGDGYRFVKLACDLVEKHGFIAYQAQVYNAMGKVAFWTQPIGTVIDFTRMTFRAAIETGDLASACYAMHQSITYLLVRNDHLDAVWRESEMALDFARTAKFRDVADLVVSQQSFIASMQGRDATLSSFSNELFDEAASEAQLTHARMPTLICLHWIRKLKARYLLGDYADALAAADKARALLWTSAAQLQMLDYFYYAALTVAALYDEAPADQQAEWRERLSAHQEQLREWSDSYPPTFGDKYALVSAEFARLEGRDLDAMRLYEEAIRAAHEHGFVQNEGLALEVAARFYAARGYETFAKTYLQNARYCYLRWGAEGKVRQLDRLHPHLAAAEEARPTATLGSPVQHLDATSVVKSSQAVSSEIVLPKLIERLMTIALENAGGDRGLLILPGADDYSIQAEAQGTGDRVEVALCQKSIAGITCPESLVRYVIRTHESVILDDASRPNLFSEDAYLRGRQPRSILCLPLIKQGKLIGLLYLENNLASHVFTAARIAVLQLLASQATISLENARLYADLIQENRERQTAEDAMRVSEARWRSLFENVPVGVTLVGLHGRYVEVNPAFCTMTGYSAAELQQLSPVDITHEEDRAASEAIIAARAAGTPYAPRLEKRYRGKNSGIIWVELNIFEAPIVGSVPLFGAVEVNITERKHAEVALQRSEAAMRVSEARWRSLFEHVPVGVALVGPDRRYVAVNPTFCRMTGYSAAELRRFSPGDITHEDDRAATEAVLAAHAAGEPHTPRIEKRYRRKDGGITWGELSTFVAPVVGSAPLHAGVIVDITERKHAEAALQRSEAAMRVSEARWRSLFEHVPVGVVLMGAHRRYVEANPAFCTMTGYSEAELQQLSPVDITYEEDRATTEVIVAAHIAGVHYPKRIEKRYRRKDGSVIWVELNLFVFEAPVVGSVPLYAAIEVDITERKRAEAALRRSEAYLTEAQRLSRTGSFVWNVASGDIFWSEASFDIFGYDDTALFNNVGMVLQRVHPEDLALVQTTIDHAASTGRDVDVEHRLLMPDGSVRYVHVVCRPLRDQADELEFIGSIMDVTAAKRAAESLHKAQADLAHAARVTTLGELAASIAHEISQPLAAVATNGDACVRWLNRDPPNLDAARQVASCITQEAHRAGDVIRSLRALAVKSGPQLTKFDLNGAIEEVLALTRGNFQRQSVALHTDLSANMQPVMGDRVQLQQVLLNLITNGIDAMGDVTDRPKVLTITSKSVQPDGVLVGVEDTGTGFEPAIADQLFAPFYTTKSNGMGMGLAICRTIIEAHGGQLWGKPNAPQGTIFQFRLATDDDLS